MRFDEYDRLESIEQQMSEIQDELARVPVRIALNIPGVGGGTTSLVVGRAIENIDAATGWLSEDDEESTTYDEPPDDFDVRALAADIEIGKGRVHVMKIISPETEDESDPPETIPIEDRDPVKMAEAEREAEDQGEPPAEPPIMELVMQWWYNPLFDPIQRNSIVIGATIGDFTMIVAVAPTTLRRNPDPPDPSP